jgi:hypothetical protein
MCVHGFWFSEIKYSQLKINHLNDTPSTKVDGAVPSTKAAGGGISVVCLTRMSRYHSRSGVKLYTELVFFGRYRLVFLGNYHTDTEGKLGRYFQYRRYKKGRIYSK